MLDLVAVVLLFLPVLLIILLDSRRRSLRRRRKANSERIRAYWREHHPGELCPECRVCRLPYPVSLPTCPFCGLSKARARALRRDNDWAVDTTTL